MELFVPGYARWCGEVKVDRDQELTITLEKGSDIHFRLLVDDPGWAFFIPDVFQDGKKVSLGRQERGGFLRGLPAGRYVLRIPSSEEIRKRSRHTLDDRTRFGAHDVPFVVHADSPAVIDLGSILLPAR
jgi:hypothetical protein